MACRYFWFFRIEKKSEIEIIPKKKQDEVKKQLDNEIENERDVFYNIEYSGLDFEGNRYIIKSKEAFNKKDNQEIVNMKNVEAKFYFKDDTVLEIFSNRAIYNSKTLISIQKILLETFNHLIYY